MNKDKIIVVGHILSVVALIACLFVWYFSDALKTIDSSSSFFIIVLILGSIIYLLTSGYLIYRLFKKDNKWALINISFTLKKWVYDR